MGLHRPERYCESSAVMLVRGVGSPSGITPFPYRILAFSLSSLVSWLYLASHSSSGHYHRQPVQI